MHSNCYGHHKEYDLFIPLLGYKKSDMISALLRCRMSHYSIIALGSTENQLHNLTIAVAIADSAKRTQLPHTGQFSITVFNYNYVRFVDSLFLTFFLFSLVFYFVLWFLILWFCLMYILGGVAIDVFYSNRFLATI